MRIDLLQQAKEAHKVTYRALAEQTGLSFAHIQQILTGTHANPTLEALRLVCNALEVSLADVMADETLPAGAGAGNSGP